MMLPLVPADKGTHFIAGNAIAVIATLVLPGMPFAGLAAAAIAGVLKEGLDYVFAYRQKKAGLPVTHTPDFMDFIATAAGGLSTSI